MLQRTVDMEVETAKAYLSARLKRRILILPPEYQDHFTKMTRQYVAGFEKILDDFLKIKQPQD